MLEVDVAAVADLCSRFLPGMVERGTGAVLNVASTAAFQPLPGQAAYGAAKAFVLSYTRSLSAELQGTGVTATVLCPGPVDTGFGEAAGFSKEDAEESLPAFMWVPAAEVARAAVDGMDKRHAGGHPRAGQPGRRGVRPPDAQAAAAADPGQEPPRPAPDAAPERRAMALRTPDVRSGRRRSLRPALRGRAAESRRPRRSVEHGGGPVALAGLQPARSTRVSCEDVALGGAAAEHAGAGQDRLELGRRRAA